MSEEKKQELHKIAKEILLSVDSAYKSYNLDVIDAATRMDICLDKIYKGLSTVYILKND